MVKRLLDTVPEEIFNMTKDELIKSINKCEGRTVVSEVIGENSLFRDVSNAEVAVSFGADLLLLNLYDINNSYFKNVPDDSQLTLVEKIKELTGRPVGVNFEPVPEEIVEKIDFPQGRLAVRENAKKAVEAGFDFLVITANPNTGVTNQKILEAIENINKKVGDKLIIMAGKMHMAGYNEELLDEKLIKSMIEAGSDVILLPAPGTVPGIDLQDNKKIIKLIHKEGKMVMNTIGTSQESADQDTIKEIALKSKMAGADIHHIGDAGYNGIALPENIMALSKTIRGRRHTYRRMALSINRSKE